MSKEQLIEQLKAELRQTKEDYLAGIGIPLEEFDWGHSSMQIAESRSSYRASEV